MSRTQMPNAETFDELPTVEEAETRLQRCGFGDLRNVECVFDNGILTISGRVSSYYAKQLAQTVLRNIAHVEQIANELDVIPSINHSR